METVDQLLSIEVFDNVKQLECFKGCPYHNYEYMDCAGDDEFVCFKGQRQLYFMCVRCQRLYRGKEEFVTLKHVKKRKE